MCTVHQIRNYAREPPDIVAFGITLMMTVILVAGVKKSLFFNNLLNAFNLVVWVFVMGAGSFYVDTNNWSQNNGFLPYGWDGVFKGAAICFYAFIGFDIIATTGEEATNPRRSIPLAIILSLIIIFVAYASCSMMITLVVPYSEIDTDSALMQMFSYVHAPACKYIVAIGALSGLTVSMFGSMFPMPRVMYAMASDGLIFTCLATISQKFGTPAFSTVIGGAATALLALFFQLETLVEMMSIGTLLAYTLVSTCVLVLRYQPFSTNLVDLLPPRLRTPVDPEGSALLQQGVAYAGVITSSSQQRVMIRRVTRSSPDSDDDTFPGDESDDGRDDTFLIHSDNEFYGPVPGGYSVSPSRFARCLDFIYRQLHAITYLCPGMLPWVEHGPATEMSGIFVIKAAGVLFVLETIFDIFAAYGNPSESTFTTVIMIISILAVFIILLAISRKPQNHANLVYMAPGLPFVPAIAVLVNIYLILNLSFLTLVRFAVWMFIGLILYFKYGIKNSTLERTPLMPLVSAPPSPNRSNIPSSSNQLLTSGDRNIFEGDRLYASHDPFPDPLLAWHVTDLEPMQTSNRPSGYMQMESRFNENTNKASSSCRPPWANPDTTNGNWG